MIEMGAICEIISRSLVTIPHKARYQVKNLKVEEIKSAFFSICLRI